MSAPRDLDRLLQSFLTDGPLELPDASYDEVRSRMDQQRQRAFIGSWRTPDMNRYLKIGLAAAAVLVIAVVAFNLLPGSAAPGGEPSATPEPTATPAAPSAAPSEAADLPLGPYALTTADGQWTVAMTVTIGAPGWIGNDSQGILTKNDNPDPPDGAGLIVFTGQLEVYGDPCRWATTRPDPMTGATVDEVIAALTAQVGRNATEPVDVTVDEYSGKSITLSVP